MRAAILHNYGGTPELGEWEDPTPSGAAVVLEVLAAALNPVDLRIASGTFYGGSPRLPYVVGAEGAGRTADGRVVYFDGAIAPHGACAERTLVGEASLLPLPEGLDPAVGASLGVAGLAAWLGLEWRGQLRPGEVVLVLGASGPVGQFALQAAKLLGAGRVIAAARDPERLETTRALGADATVSLGETDHAALVAAFREAGGGGVDLVIDPLWGAPAAAALDACNLGARLVQLGESAAASASLSSASVRGKLLSIVGHTNFAAPQDVKRAAFSRLAEHAAAGRLRVELERMPLDQAAEAWERQRRGPGHKLVLVP